MNWNDYCPMCQCLKSTFKHNVTSNEMLSCTNENCQMGISKKLKNWEYKGEIKPIKEGYESFGTIFNGASREISH